MHLHRTPVSGRKVRFAVVGCGRIAQNHFECHRPARRARRTGRRVRQRPRDARRGHRQDRRARVRVTQATCSPRRRRTASCSPRRAACTRARRSKCARAGVDVMTEKPMATRWHDGLAMVRACDEAGVHLFVVKQNRRNPTLQLLKRAVDEGRFGRIYMVDVNVFWTRPQAYYDSAAWRGTWEFDGGAFMNQASHYVDLLDWLDRPGGERAGLHRHPGAQHRGRGHRRRRRALAQRRRRLDQRDDADLSEEPGRIDHHPRREGHGAHRRRGGQRDRALGVRPSRTRWTTQIAERELPDDLGLRLRPSAVLRQRDQHAARRGASPRPTAARA